MNLPLEDLVKSSPSDSLATQEPAFFPTATVAILGLGLMGGSLAMALRSHCARLIGADIDSNVVRRALEEGVVEDASTNLIAILPQADLIVLAVPVRASIAILQQLPELLPGNTMLIDLGSTKGMVLQAMSALPDRIDALGGHPMCGKENSTLANAEAGLYRGAPFALLPLPRTTPRLRQVALELVSLLGARPLWLDAGQHDHWVAFTSHLPHLLATALVLSTPPACAPLAGPGYRSSSRLAAGSADMRVDIYATNAPAVLEALSCYRQQLEILEKLVQQGDWENLRDLLAMGAGRRSSFLGEGK